MEDCYYEVYAMCQEGMLSIKYDKVEFDDGRSYSMIGLLPTQTKCGFVVLVQR